MVKSWASGARECWNRELDHLASSLQRHSEDSCTDMNRIWKHSPMNPPSMIIVETEFTVSLPLETRRTLLSFLMKEPPECELYSENSYFCAVIHENLISAGNGVNVSDTATKFSMVFCSEDQGKNQKVHYSFPNLLAEEPPHVPLPAPVGSRSHLPSSQKNWQRAVPSFPGGGVPMVPLNRILPRIMGSQPRVVFPQSLVLGMASAQKFPDGQGSDLRWPTTFHGSPSTKRVKLTDSIYFGTVLFE
ncbi:hypothetical protein BS47DRAFT_978821 [Hydnum rufescens UP504]|uniref:Uncharacterized protein n=1 Tax=Hydnum rufescens UP504 TaxID=1448309 RepID=A0A9P6ABJ3_9AGAM|nr:hypothetical protein BS47DRAFT_978821 [Hydnum rufescens UP504]